MGLLASVLAEAGYDITPIEPGAKGFGFMPQLAALVNELATPGSTIPPLPISASELDPERHAGLT